MVKHKYSLYLLLFTWSCFLPAKYQVCSITINSSDEIEVFKSVLGEKDFEYNELVPLSTPLSNDDVLNNTHWFLNACRNQIKCDIIVKSGHYGDVFFGEKHNYVLPSSIMERQACLRTCHTVLSQAIEVFLFGCNTLAGKREDKRKPEEYRQILLDHGMPVDMAERVTAIRYLPFDLSFKGKMQLIFSKERNQTTPTAETDLYGFVSLSPYGRQIRAPLTKYLRSIQKRYGSYKRYLDQKKKEWNNNPLFKQEIGGYATQVKGIFKSDDTSSALSKICLLHSDSVSTREGLINIRTLMENGDGPMALSAIRGFVSQRKQTFSREDLEIFNTIKGNDQFKDEFFPLYRQISTHLPYIRIQFLNFLKLFDWLPSDSFYRTEIHRNALKMVTQPTPEAHDFALALVYDEGMTWKNLFLKEADFHETFYHNHWSPLILQALDFQNRPNIQRHLMNLCLSTARKEPPIICFQVLKTLGHLGQLELDELVYERLVEFSELEHQGFAFYSIYALRYALKNVDNHEQYHKAHRSIARQLNRRINNDDDIWVQLQAIKTLGFFQSQDRSVNRQMVNLVANSENAEVICESLKSLSGMNPNRDSLTDIIRARKLHQHPQEGETIRQIEILANAFLNNQSLPRAMDVSCKKSE